MKQFNRSTDRNEEGIQMNIRHRPLFDTQKVIDHYSKKDGVPIQYVCTKENA